MPGKKRVLITGAAGLIGRALSVALGDDYVVSGLDVRPVSGSSSSILVADMSGTGALDQAFEGKDVVIDLAAVTSHVTPWDAVYKNNIASTYNALEASRRAGVRRIIFASSNHVTGMYERQHPYSAIVAGRYEGLDRSAIPYITTSMPICPDSPYGISKAFGEAAGRYFSDEYGMSVICLRIGSFTGEGRPRSTRSFATLLTPRDQTQLVTRCIEAPDSIRFAVFYGVSDNTWRFWDISDAMEVVGYQPQDNAEDLK